MTVTWALTANEAAAASRVPLKHVHRIIDAGLLAGAVQTRAGIRMIEAPGLLALKLAYATADVLKPEARRRAVLRALEGTKKPEIRDKVVVVKTSAIEAELEEGLAELRAAKAMVAADPEVMGGAPCFVGTRIPVHDVAELLSRGEAVEGLLSDYPALDERHIHLAAVFAAAYPRRGRPPTPPWRAMEPLSSETVRLENLPAA